MVNQVPAMEERGYFIEPAVFSAEECVGLLERLRSAQLKRSRAGARHLMHLPVVHEVASDPRLLDVAGNLLGGEAVPFKATLFEKSSEQNWLIPWHQDTALPLESKFDASGWGPWSVKDGIHYAHAPTWALRKIVAARVHLDESGSDNGPLRAIPGSHRDGVLTDEEAFLRAGQAEAIECCSPVGGTLFMSPLLIHASSKGTSDRPRRVLHIEYASALDLASGIRLATA